MISLIKNQLKKVNRIKETIALKQNRIQVKQIGFHDFCIKNIINFIKNETCSIHQICLLTSLSRTMHVKKRWKEKKCQKRESWAFSKISIITLKSQVANKIMFGDRSLKSSYCIILKSIKKNNSHYIYILVTASFIITNKL